MHLFTNEVLFYCLLACLLTCLFALLCLLFCCFEIITNNLNGKIKQRSLCCPSPKLAFEMWSKLQIPGENCAGQSILLKVFLKCGNRMLLIILECGIFWRMPQQPMEDYYFILWCFSWGRLVVTPNVPQLLTVCTPQSFFYFVLILCHLILLTLCLHLNYNHLFS